MIIYTVKDKENRIVYVGQTINTLEKRIKGHLDTSRYSKVKYPLAQAIHEQGIKSFKFEVIDQADSLEKLNELEDYYIVKYNTVENGYNTKAGGGNKRLSEHTKNKISKSQKGELNHMYGKFGKDNKCSKKVINLITGDTYHSVTECSENENESISKISQVCRGERRGLNGNVYRYIDENGYIQNVKNDNIPKTKPVFNKTQNKFYKSLKEASIGIGKEGSYLSRYKIKPRTYTTICNNIFITI